MDDDLAMNAESDKETEAWDREERGSRKRNLYAARGVSVAPTSVLNAESETDADPLIYGFFFLRKDSPQMERATGADERDPSGENAGGHRTAQHHLNINQKRRLSAVQLRMDLQRALISMWLWREHFRSPSHRTRPAQDQNLSEPRHCALHYPGWRNGQCFFGSRATRRRWSRK